MNTNSKINSYVVKLNEDTSCPFLNKDNLCKLQLEYGEDYLSQTCSTYPRQTYSVGKIFERSMTLTCPVAAEMILFNEEPMKFEFVDVLDKVHSKHGRIHITRLPVVDDEDELFCEVQITMISILQERRFSIDQRLIVLGLFIDRFQEYQIKERDEEILLDLMAAYRSEEFLLQEISPLFQSFAFDANKFIMFIMKFFSHVSVHLKDKKHYHFLRAFTEVLEIKPDEHDEIFLPDIIPTYEKLAEARQTFSQKYSTFLENYLLNDMFLNFYPWRFREESVTKNFAVFLISYKIFELLLFTATQKKLDSKEDLLQFVNWFTLATTHNKALYKRFLELLEGIDNTYLLMVTLL